MGLLDGLIPALVGGGLDLFAGQEANTATLEAAKINAQAQKFNQNEALNALQGSDAFTNISRNAAGGFDVKQQGGADAATTRSTLAAGDPARALKLNAADTNFNFQLPQLSDAQGIVSRDNTLQQGQFDKGVADVIGSRRRSFGGIENTGETPATIDALARFSDANRFGGEREALDLFNKSGLADIGLKNAIKASLASQAPAPGFTTGGPGGAAANVIVQSPPPNVPVDLGSTLPFAAGGNIVKQLQQAEQARTDNENFLEALRTLGNQGTL